MINLWCINMSKSTMRVNTDMEELDSSSGCDMSFENSHENLQIMSPPTNPVPRRLNFDNNSRTPASKVHLSPPCNRIRKLRLFNCPLTPRSIFEKSVCPSTPRITLFPCDDKPRAVRVPFVPTEKPAANVNPFTPTGKLIYYIILYCISYVSCTPSCFESSLTVS